MECSSDLWRLSFWSVVLLGHRGNIRPTIRNLRNLLARTKSQPCLLLSCQPSRDWFQPVRTCYLKLSLACCYLSRQQCLFVSRQKSAVLPEWNKLDPNHCVLGIFFNIKNSEPEWSPERSCRIQTRELCALYLHTCQVRVTLRATRVFVVLLALHISRAN